jgi:hypothetical protein
MAYLDPSYKKAKPRPLGRPRKPWRAYYYANGGRTYLGNFATKAEAVQREYTEKLRHQRELLEKFPEEIRYHRQQNLLDRCSQV